MPVRLPARLPIRLPRSRRARWTAIAVPAVLALLGGAFLTYNTHVLGPEKLCHGLVSAEDVKRAFPGMGRLSGEDSGTGRSRSCTVERSAVGTGDARFSLRVSSETASFPFDVGHWEMTASGDVLTGATPGTADPYKGWVLLPSSCAALSGPAGPAGSAGRPVLRVSVEKGSAEPAALARLLAAAAASLTAESGCPPRTGAGGDDVQPASAVSPTDLGRVCSLPGFRLGKVTGPRGGTVQERTSGSFDTAWFCDLSFTGDERDGPFTTLAVVKDPELAAVLKERNVKKATCGGRETYFLQDNATYPWEPEERAAAGFPAESELSDLFSEAARKALHCS
ncbi:hypothetical protein AB0O07_20610 [Streptomyces sp. NPDC093085]|uniref:hypothetical protein n=1 Tax=Streptomyces sp. NPDC093085 TaxID=3155068 RepID=UPI003424D451